MQKWFTMAMTMLMKEESCELQQQQQQQPCWRRWLLLQVPGNYCCL